MVLVYRSINLSDQFSVQGFTKTKASPNTATPSVDMGGGGWRANVTIGVSLCIGNLSDDMRQDRIRLVCRCSGLTLALAGSSEIINLVQCRFKIISACDLFS